MIIQSWHRTSYRSISSEVQTQAVTHHDNDMPLNATIKISSNPQSVIRKRVGLYTVVSIVSGIITSRQAKQASIKDGHVRNSKWRTIQPPTRPGVAKGFPVDTLAE
jgi:hypothetical protein